MKSLVILLSLVLGSTCFAQGSVKPTPTPVDPTGQNALLERKRQADFQQYGNGGAPAQATDDEGGTVSTQKQKKPKKPSVSPTPTPKPKPAPTVTPVPQELTEAQTNVLTQFKDIIKDGKYSTISAALASYIQNYRTLAPQFLEAAANAAPNQAPRIIQLAFQLAPDQRAGLQAVADKIMNSNKPAPTPDVPKLIVPDNIKVEPVAQTSPVVK